MQNSSRHSLLMAVSAAALLIVLLGIPSIAHSQLAPVGGSVDSIPGFPIVRGTDSAYDPVNRVYLQVSAHQAVTAVFVNEAGAVVSGLIPIAPGVAFAAYPRVTYSPHVNGTGGFLVVWHQQDGPFVGFIPNVVHARTVAYAASPVLGNDVVLGVSPFGSWTEAAPAVSYSSQSQQFLVAWQAANLFEIHAVRVGLDGQPLAAWFTISDVGTGGRDPGVAWNSQTNEFGVSYSGWDAHSPTVTLARVRPSDGAVLKRTIIYRSQGTFITDVAFNPTSGNYVVAYAAPGTRTTEVSGAGDVVQHGVVASAIGTYDGLAIAFNAPSGRMLMVGHFTTQVGGVELDGKGTKIGPEQEVTSAAALPAGSLYPRAAGNTVVKQWHVSFSRTFAAAASQAVATTGGGGGPADSDGDGVPDTSDACPNQYGTLPNGCPVPPASDADGDGVADSADQCPTVFGQSAQGCPVVAPPLPPPDLNGDSLADLVFQNGNGHLHAWFMNSWQVIGNSDVSLTPRAAPWTVVASRDFTGEGQTDLLWHNSQTGELNLWKMSGLAKVGEQSWFVGANWTPVATGDMNGDGSTDLVWEDFGAGTGFIWFMKAANGQAGFAGVNGAFLGDFIRDSSTTVIALGPSQWRIAGTGDLNGDGKSDVILQHDGSGELHAWFMASQVVHGFAAFSPRYVNPAWKIRSVADFNGDTRPDLVFRHDATGHLYIWFMDGLNITVNGFLNYGVPVNLNWKVVGAR